MGWKTETAVSTEKMPLEVLLKKESNWTSHYDEPERWKKDMKDCYYNLIGEYVVEPGLTLYRFELDETHRKDLAPNSSHFQNVLIRTVPKKNEQV